MKVSVSWFLGMLDDRTTDKNERKWLGIVNNDYDILSKVISLFRHYFKQEIHAKIITTEKILNRVNDYRVFLEGKNVSKDNIKIQVTKPNEKLPIDGTSISVYFYNSKLVRNLIDKRKNFSKVLDRDLLGSYLAGKIDADGNIENHNKEIRLSYGTRVNNVSRVESEVDETKKILDSLKIGYKCKVYERKDGKKDYFIILEPTENFVKYVVKYVVSKDKVKSIKRLLDGISFKDSDGLVLSHYSTANKEFTYKDIMRDFVKASRTSFKILKGLNEAEFVKVVGVDKTGSTRFVVSGEGRNWLKQNKLSIDKILNAITENGNYNHSYYKNKIPIENLC